MLDTSKIPIQARENGDQRAKLPVIGSSGDTAVNGNYSIVKGVDIPIFGKELFIANDSTDVMTITITMPGGSLSFILNAGDTIDERFPPFSRVDVVATGNWRWYVRGNLT